LLFLIFGYLIISSERLDDEETDKPLPTSATSILSSIPESEYRKTFKKYIERLELCVLVEEDYFEHLMK
jgi:hypothetical protein